MIPFWLKIAYTLFVTVLVPVYWVRYGPANFLWACDIALLVTVVTLWRESRLLASMMAVAVLLPELLWNLDFFLRLATGRDVIGLDATGYMFNPQQPLPVRLPSLFPVFLPLLLLWLGRGPPPGAAPGTRGPRPATGAKAAGTHGTATAAAPAMAAADRTCSRSPPGRSHPGP